MKEELRKLNVACNEAGAKKDRAALERLFADEFVWYQANGRVVDKPKLIISIIGNDAEFSVPVGSFEGVLVFGDVAVNRVAVKGGVTTTIYARRDGRWRFVQAVGARALPERKPVDIDPKTFDSLVGKCEVAPSRVATVSREGNSLMWQGGRRPKVRLLPLSETRFFVEDTDMEVIFRRSETGQVIGLTLRQGSYQDSEF